MYITVVIYGYVFVVVIVSYCFSIVFGCYFSKESLQI